MFSKIVFCLLCFLVLKASAFTVQHKSLSVSRVVPAARPLRATEQEEGIVELAEDTEDKTLEAPVAPFLSQGEIDPDAMPSDLSDGKEVRVILYTVISLLPVLFLIPFMLGSRDMLASMLPPVDI